MPKTFIEKQERQFNIESFLTYWNTNVVEPKLVQISSALLNKAYHTLYGITPKDNCSTCLRNRAAELKNIFESNTKKEVQVEVKEEIQEPVIVLPEGATGANQTKPKNKTRNKKK